MDGKTPRLPGQREPSASNDGGQHSPEEASEHQESRSQSHRWRAPTREQILEALAQLAGMHWLGVISSSRAAVQTRIFETLLKHLADNEKKWRGRSRRQPTSCRV